MFNFLKVGLLFFVFLFFHFGSLVSQNTQTLYPKVGQAMGVDSINFQWQQYAYNANYQIKIADDPLLNQLILDTTLSENQITASFSYGDYYWKVYYFQNGTLVDSSDQSSFTVFSPLNDTSLRVWLRSDSLVQLTNGLISTWGDLSNGNDLVQSLTNRRASLTAGIINGYPAVAFDGIDDTYEIPISMLDSNYSITVVCDYRGGVANNRLIYGTSNWFMGPYQNQWRFYDGGFTTGSIVDTSRFVVHSVFSDTDSSFNFVNGLIQGNNSTGFPPGPRILFPLDPVNTRILEVIIHSGKLNINKIDSVNQYLMNKYAPPINLGSDRVVCSFPDTLSLEVDYLRSYNWSTADTTNYSVINSAGIYYLDAIDEFGRQTTDTIEYFLDTSDPTLSFAFNDTTICEGESISIAAGPERFSYQWNTGATANSLLIDSAGWYKVTATNCLSGISIDSFRVRVNQPEFDLGPDTVICFNESYILQTDSNFSNVNYVWSDNSTADSLQIINGGLYSLTVTDNYGCDFQDSVLVNVDSSLFGLSLFPDTSLCEGNEIGLIGNVPNGLNYQWGTGNSSSTQTIDTAGAYALTVSNAFCSFIDTVNIAIKGLAPTADFIFNDLCFNDSVSFIDNSSAPLGDSLVSYLWDFASLDSSSQILPSYQFPDTGLFRVGLKVQSDKGCEDTLSRLVDIQALPQVDFEIVGNCSGLPIQFNSNTTIAEGAIQSFQWDFDDGSISNQQNPIHNYNSYGNYNVKLIAFSDQNCVDSVSRNVVINPQASLDYELIGQCLGDSSHFLSLATTDTGSIAQTTWFINQQIIEDSLADILFLSKGPKQIILRVETDSSCISILRDTIDIYESPTADFIVNDICKGDSLKVLNNSSAGDGISQYLYSLNGPGLSDSSNLENPQFFPDQTGDYQLSLKVETVNSCSDSTQKTVSVIAKPSADFQILNNTSGAPYSLAVQNNSMNADSYLWRSGHGQTSNSEEAEFNYQDSGRYDLQLIASNQSGCSDSLQRELFVIEGYLDAAIESAQMLPDQSGNYRIRLRIANTGNNTIDQLLLNVLPENGLGFAEEIDLNLYKGNSINNLLSSIISRESPNPAFICFEIQKVNGVEDEVSANNRFCIAVFPEELYLKTYPNPVRDRLQIDFVLLQSAAVSILIFDQLGKEVYRDLDEVQLNEGFQQRSLPLESLNSGIYILKLIVNGSANELKFIKQ